MRYFFSAQGDFRAHRVRAEVQERRGGHRLEQRGGAGTLLLTLHTGPREHLQGQFVHLSYVLSLQGWG